MNTSITKDPLSLDSSKNTAPPKEAYQSWLSQYAPYLNHFITLSFPHDLSIRSAHNKALKYIDYTNQTAFGRDYKKNGFELMSIGSIEGNIRPHIHILQERHPILNEHVYDYIAREHLHIGGCKSAIKVKRIHDIEYAETLIGYITKYITWRNAIKRLILPHCGLPETKASMN